MINTTPEKITVVQSWRTGITKLLVIFLFTSKSKWGFVRFAPEIARIDERRLFEPDLFLLLLK